MENVFSSGGGTALSLCMSIIHSHLREEQTWVPEAKAGTMLRVLVLFVLELLQETVPFVVMLRGLALPCGQVGKSAV